MPAPKLIPALTTADRERFGRFVEPAPGCWPWRGVTAGRGYGRIRLDGSRYYFTAHRIAWVLAHGPVPDGLLVLHNCDNPPCVKTEGDEQWPNGHLFVGTQAENLDDCEAKGRVSHVTRNYGTLNSKAVLTDERVWELRRRYAAGERNKDLLVESGLGPGSAGHLSLILRGKKWRHVPMP